MPALWRRKGYPSRGLVHPRTRVGEGPVRYKYPRVAGTQETMGGAGTERSEVESLGRDIPSSGHTTIRKKRVTEVN